MDDISLLKNRFLDMANRAETKGTWVYSEFLTEAEQSELRKMRLSVGVDFYGGYEAAERQITVFGDEADIYYPPEPPVVFIKISPLQNKFADNLSHRDFLGSLMALGIKREMLGDILINENTAYVVCMEKIADYIMNELADVKHTSVRTEKANALPDIAQPQPEYTECIVSSERLDVLTSAVYNLSRSDSQKLIEAERVFVNSILAKSTSAVLKIGEKISVRGFGRFVYDGIIKTTKKGRFVVAVKKY